MNIKVLTSGAYIGQAIFIFYYSYYYYYFLCSFESRYLREYNTIEGEKKKEKGKLSLRAGFEPAREDPIGFQVQRLNHSAITALDILGEKFN